MGPRVVLVGMPGSGKTAVGRALAARLRCGFVDADDEIVARDGREIAEIFATDGEGAFRALEAETIEALLGSDHVVVSLGGGAVLTEATRRRLAAGCPVAWLRVEEATLVERLSGWEAAGRPLLAGDVGERVATLHRQRRHLYEEVATVVVDADEGGPDRVAAALLASLEAAAPA